MDVKIFIDNDGRARAIAKKPYQMAALFLEAEIQGDKIHNQELLDLVKMIINNEMAHWEETGNICTLRLEPGRALITHEITQEFSEISLDYFQALLGRWMCVMEKIQIQS